MELRHLRYDSDTHPWIDISIDVQDRKLNVLFEGVFDDLLAAIERIRSGSLDRPVVLRSAKEKGFVVGADLKKILAIDSDAGIQAFLKHGQDVLIELEQLPNPTFAWIRGPCLGGGLELALACKFLLV